MENICLQCYYKTASFYRENIIDINLVESYFFKIIYEEPGWEFKLISLIEYYEIHKEHYWVPFSEKSTEEHFCCNLHLESSSNNKENIITIINYYIVKELLEFITDDLIVEKLNLFFIKFPYYEKLITTYLKLYPFEKNKKTSWKGSDFYYRRIFGLPKILNEINIPVEHYEKKYVCGLCDSIKGHPKASHGWFRESMDELELQAYYFESPNVSSSDTI